MEQLPTMGVVKRVKKAIEAANIESKSIDMIGFFVQPPGGAYSLPSTAWEIQKALDFKWHYQPLMWRRPCGGTVMLWVVADSI